LFIVTKGPDPESHAAISEPLNLESSSYVSISTYYKSRKGVEHAIFSLAGLLSFDMIPPVGRFKNLRV